MKFYEEKLKEYIKKQNLKAKHLSFDQSCHSVAQAAQVVSASEEDFVKTICFLNRDQLIAVIVKGEDRVSSKRVQKIIEAQKLELATPEQILEKTGFPCGGVPPIGFQAIFLIDDKVMVKETVYAGGGSQQSLLKITTKELLEVNTGQVVRIRK